MSWLGRCHQPRGGACKVHLATCLQCAPPPSTHSAWLHGRWLGSSSLCVRQQRTHGTVSRPHHGRRGRGAQPGSHSHCQWPQLPRTSTTHTCTRQTASVSRRSVAAAGGGVGGGACQRVYASTRMTSNQSMGSSSLRTRPLLTSGTALSPNMDLSTARALARTTWSGRDSNRSASSPATNAIRT